MVFVIYLRDYEVHKFHLFLFNSSNSVICNSRIRIITYVADKSSTFYENFPINILRNIGIRNTQTSHFVFLDFDMWPSCNLLIIYLNDFNRPIL